MEHTKVLAVFANPIGTDPLRLGAEDRVIRECLTRSKYRDRIQLDILHAATIHDVRRTLLEGSYRIVQISGHGTGKGLAFEDEQGEARLVPIDALAELLSAYSPPIECVVLNACYSNIQGQLASSLGVPCTIGMEGPISDESAIEFTRGFYDAVGAGKPIEFAYQEGCRSIKLSHYSSVTVPVLMKKPALLANQRTMTFDVQVDDITAFDADVVALKFAQHLYGAAFEVAMALNKSENESMNFLPTLGQYKLFPTLGRIKAKHALFLSVPSLSKFGYAQIREFAAQVLKILRIAAPNTRHLAMTIHGRGYGLDEAEALRSQLAGCFDALESGEFTSALERITIVERHWDRALRLQRVLNEVIPQNPVILPHEKEPAVHQHNVERSPLINNVGQESVNKPHVFVVMPFSEDMEDVYYFGIQSPVNAAGYLCERIDLTSLSSDIFEQIKSRIETASFVITELSHENPNVFLLLGYSLGRGRPTILLTRKPDTLPFDASTQQCLVYNRIRDLDNILERELSKMTPKKF